MRRLPLVALALALSLSACAPSHPTKGGEHPGSAAADKAASELVSQRLAEAKQLLDDKDWPKALSVLESLIDSSSFSKLNDDLQYQVLTITGRTAVDHGPPQLAYQYLIRVTSMRQATDIDWYARLRAAGKLNNDSGVITALTVLGRRWPDRLRQLNDDYVLYVIRVASRLRDGSDLALLQSLYDAHWKEKWDIEPSSSWRDLSLGLLGKGQLRQASAVAARVTDPYVLVAMRADRRFDAVVAANPGQFDTDAAADRAIEFFQAASEAAPKSLELKWRLIAALLCRQHYEAAMAASDSVLSDIRSTNFPEKLFEDLADQRSTFLDVRATALERLERWEEAVAQMSAASLLPEKYSGNVDQIINLGALYCALQRPSDCLSAIGRLTAKTNAFGAMQLEDVRVDAAIQMEDGKQVDRSLSYMRAHRADAPDSYDDALLTANQIDRAAAELIRELLDEHDRQGALLRIQIFLPTPDTPRNLKLAARRRTMINRPDVQAAIRKVGRVESYRLEGQW